MLKNPLYKYGTLDVKIPYRVSLGDFILDEVLQYGERVALINAATHDELLYKTIGEEAMSIALSLSQLGVRKGDVIAVASENCNEFWSTFVGIICAGAVFTPINIAYTKDELKHVLNISKPRFMFCSTLGYTSCGATIKTIKSIEKIISFGERESTKDVTFKDMASMKVIREDFMSLENSADDTAVMLYSSGTTGLPKGVMLSHHNGVVLLTMWKTAGPETDQTTSLHIAPWFHAMGMWGALSGLCNGRRAVYLTRFEEKLYLETIQRYKPLIITVVPPVLVLLGKSQLLAQYDVTSVQVIHSGAAPADSGTIEEVKKRFPNVAHVSQGYGMTEMTCAVSLDGQSNNVVRDGSVGTVMPGVTFKIVDVETRKPVGPNQRGEICAKGPLLMKGYIGGDNNNIKDEEGFLKSGDVGYFDEDGWLYIVDRIKELIKYKGFQVAPAELEAELLQHPAVRDAGVVGKPDKMAGEVPVAFVVRQPGCDVSEEELKEYIAGKLSNPKHLRGGVRFVDAIPKNASGKIMRRALKGMLRTGWSKL